MNKNVRIGLAGAALALMTTTTTLPVIGAVSAHAQVSQVNDVEEKPLLTEQEAAQFDRYIVVKDNQYAIQIPKGVKVDSDLLKRAQQQVQQTNEQLKVTPVILDPTTKSGEYTLDEPETGDSEEDDIDLEKGRKGKTKIKLYWNFARVWISKGTLRNMAWGLSLAGVFIPHPTAARACSAAGIIIGRAPCGIRFDMNYYTKAVWNIRRQ